MSKGKKLKWIIIGLDIMGLALGLFSIGIGANVYFSTMFSNGFGPGPQFYWWTPLLIGSIAVLIGLVDLIIALIKRSGRIFAILVLLVGLFGAIIPLPMYSGACGYFIGDYCMGLIPLSQEQYDKIPTAEIPTLP